MAGGRAGRNYVRDGNGRFASSPGGGGSSAKPRRGAKQAGGTLKARMSLAKSRAKLTANQSSAQRGAVTRATKKLAEVRKLSLRRMPTTGRANTMRGKVQRDPGAAARLAAARQGRPGGGRPGGGGRRPNVAAQRAKEMANRTGTVAGRHFTDGQAQKTLSLREMRTAVRQSLKGVGITTRKQFQAIYGKPPTTRGGWERLYREHVQVPMADRNRRERPGVINGIDIQKNFRPWAVFGLNPKTATRDDVNRAFRRLALQNHPDVGGRRKDIERLQTMRNSVLATMPQPKAAKSSRGGGAGRGGGRKGKASAAAAPQGPRLLPPARSQSSAKPKGGKKASSSSKPKRSRKPKG